jgi:hypothetical protein
MEGAGQRSGERRLARISHHEASQGIDPLTHWLIEPLKKTKFSVASFQLSVKSVIEWELRTEN